MSKASTNDLDQPIRTENEVLNDLEQLIQTIDVHDNTLRGSRTTLRALENKLQNKKLELEKASTDNQQQIESLVADYQGYSKNSQDSQARKQEMQQQALAEMVASAELGVNNIKTQIDDAIEAYQINEQQIKELKNNQYLFDEQEKLERAEELVELLRTNDTLDQQNLTNEQFEIAEEIAEYIKNNESKGYKNSLDDDLDSYIEQEINKLDLAISSSDTSKQKLEDFIKTLKQGASELDISPTEGLASAIQNFTQLKGEKLTEMCAGHGVRVGGVRRAWCKSWGCAPGMV
ncbi:MAG: hypothetical protein AB8B66_04900 [Rickettsiaceae bacterium]